MRKYYIYGNFCVIDPTYVVNSGGSTSPDGSGTVGASGSSNSAGDQDFSSKLTSLKIVESENDKTGTEKLSYALKKADEACGIALEDDRYEIDRKISVCRGPILHNIQEKFILFLLMCFFRFFKVFAIFRYIVEEEVAFLQDEYDQV